MIDKNEDKLLAAMEEIFGLKMTRHVDGGQGVQLTITSPRYKRWQLDHGVTVGDIAQHILRELLRIDSVDDLIRQVEKYQ